MEKNHVQCIINELYYQPFPGSLLLKQFCLSFQVHQDDFTLNVKLQLFALIAKQPAFHQLRSVEQLGYITVLMQRYIMFLLLNTVRQVVCCSSLKVLFYLNLTTTLSLGVTLVFMGCSLSFSQLQR